MLTDVKPKRLEFGYEKKKPYSIYDRTFFKHFLNVFTVGSNHTVVSRTQLVLPNTLR